MHFLALVFFLLGSSQALSGHSHFRPRAGVPHGGNFNARVRLAARGTATLDAHRLGKRAGRLQARKTPGQGDDTSFPSNAASGTFTAKQGCAVWHTVADGEVCLGLIDKSSSGFTLDKFIKFNPSVGDNCENLTAGLAYCVDTTAGNAKASSDNGSTQKTSNNNLADSNPSGKNSTTPANTGSTDEGDGEDCEDDSDDSNSDDGDDEDCEDDDSNGDDSGSTDDSSSNNAGISASAAVDSSPSPSSSSAQQPKSTPSQQSQNNGGNNSQGQSGNSNGNENGNGNGNGNSGNSGAQASGQFDGTGTWYTQNGNAGACGNYNQDSAMIVALYTSVYNSGSHCGASVTLTNTATGKTVNAVVADECPTCGGSSDIDLSQGVFGALTDGDFGAGVVNVKWDINS